MQRKRLSTFGTVCLISMLTLGCFFSAPSATKTPLPTDAPLPTETPVPTDTPAPTATHTPRPTERPPDTATPKPTLAPTRIPPTVAPAVTSAPPAGGTGNGTFMVSGKIPGHGCRVEVWGPERHTIDAAYDQTTSVTSTPGEYGWGAFVDGAQLVSQTPPVILKAGGTCSFTCSEEGDNWFIRYGCSP
jgi:hypothetical protein